MPTTKKTVEVTYTESELIVLLCGALSIPTTGVEIHPEIGNRFGDESYLRTIRLSYIESEVEPEV